MTARAGVLAVLVSVAACGPAAPAAPPAAPPGQVQPPAPVKAPVKQIKYDVMTPPRVEFIGPRGTGPTLEDDATGGAVAMFHYIATAAGKRFAGTVPDEMGGTRRPFDPLPDDPAKRDLAPRPFVVELGRQHLVPGFDMALRTLRVGDHAKAFVRSDLAYGDAGFPAGDIPRRADVEYEIWVLQRVAPPTWEVLQAGEGPPGRTGAFAAIHYVSRMPDGTVVEDTRAPRRSGAPALPLRFHVNGGEVMEGFDRIVSQIRLGDRVRSRIPWFYDRGSAPRVVNEVKVPAMTELTYEIEFIEQEGS